MTTPDRILMVLTAITICMNSGMAALAVYSFFFRLRYVENQMMELRGEMEPAALRARMNAVKRMK